MKEPKFKIRLNERVGIYYKGKLLYTAILPRAVTLKEGMQDIRDNLSVQHIKDEE